jgi:ADP-heptose:LPS heptosyltransferase
MKRLIFRLSSLGDLILSQSVLEPPFLGETHWVVAKEFEGLVLGNPKIEKVWSFDRRAGGGLSAWFSFLAELRREEFSEVLDVHSTVRTQIARLYFKFYSNKTRWRKISKERTRRIGYEIFKRAWPVALRPTHFARKCALLAGGYGNERPNLRWMLISGSAGRGGQSRIAIVPSSAWPGKEWPMERYLEWMKRHLRGRGTEELLLLGTKSDESAVALREALLRERVPFTDGIGKYGLSELAEILAGCTTAIGSDTGLLHLAEAVGTPVITLFGPTRMDFGFGPVDEKSKPIQTSLWCSPCSKDGSLCFRPVRRYECLRRIEVSAVEGALKTILPNPSTAPSEGKSP